MCGQKLHFQRAMLHSISLHKSDEGVQCQSHHKLTSLPTNKWACWMYVKIVKNLFYKAKEEGKDLFKCLMVYCNTLLSNSLQSPMQMLSSRPAGSDLPMSNTARKQLGIDCEDLRKGIKMNTCHCMTSIWIKQSCNKTQQANSGIQLPLQDCVKSPEVI